MRVLVTIPHTEKELKDVFSPVKITPIIELESEDSSEFDDELDMAIFATTQQ